MTNRRLVKANTPIEYFTKLITIESNGCWVWRGSLDDDGYGRFQFDKIEYKTHKFSYEYYNNTKLNKEDTLDHLCRVRACANPEHLEIVSTSINTARMLAYKILKLENEKLKRILRENNISYG